MVFFIIFSQKFPILRCRIHRIVRNLINEILFFVLKVQLSVTIECGIRYLYPDFPECGVFAARGHINPLEGISLLFIKRENQVIVSISKDLFAQGFGNFPDDLKEFFIFNFFLFIGYFQKFFIDRSHIFLFESISQFLKPV